MNAQTYLSVTARLAYYDAMKITAPRRVEKEKRARPPRKPLLRMPKRKDAVLLPSEGLHA